MDIRQIHNLLADWANWHCRMLETSGLGYGDTITGKAMKGDIVKGGKPSTVVPRLDIPHHLRDVDRALRTMPRHLKIAVVYKFGWCSDWKAPVSDTDRFKAWAVKTKKTSRDTYQRHLSNAVWYVAGRLEKRA